MSEIWEQQDEVVAPTIPTASWEQQDDIVEGSYAQKFEGAISHGIMGIGQGLLRLPAATVRQASFIRQSSFANRVLEAETTEEQTYWRKKMSESQEAFEGLAGELELGAELHKQGMGAIQRNHPEWESAPPESFVDLVAHPGKLVLALAESAPLLATAGVLTAAGQPNLGVAMMYATEGEQARSRAKAAGASDQDAAIAYGLYGSVSAALEQMQLKGIMKIGKGTYNAVLNRTVQKLGKVGSKSLTFDVIKVAANEAIQEMAQGTWDDITAKTIYDDQIPGGVRSFIDRRAQEGYVAFFMGLIPGAGGATLGKIRSMYQTVDDTPTTEALAVAPPVVEEKPTEKPITPEQKEAALRYIGDIETIVEEQIINKFPDPITDQKSLERVGNAMAKELGVEGITWRAKNKGWMAQFNIGARRVEINLSDRYWHKDTEGFWTKRGTFIDIQNKTPGRINQDLLKRTIVHELGHDFPSFRYVSKTGRRMAHSKAFSDWVNAGVTNLFEQVEKKVAPVERAEAVGPVGVVPVAEAAEAAIEGPLQVPAEPTKPTEPRKPKLSRSKALKLGHTIPKALEWTEPQRRDFMQNLIGKSSMKNMTPEELRTVVEALQAEARAKGIMPEEGFEKTMFVGPREVNTEEFMEAALDQVKQLPDKTGEIPETVTRRIARRIARKKRGTVLTSIKNVLIGIDNLSIPHLMRKIGGAQAGPMKEVGVDNWRRSTHRISSVFRWGVDQLNRDLDAAGVTPKDLAEMSRSLDPRLELVKRGRELIDKPKTKDHSVKINNKTYKLTMGNLLDIYLSARQEKGLAHITKKGLNISGIRTGAINEETLQRIIDAVESDPKAMAFAESVAKISTEYNAPQLNYTDSRINPESVEKLADEENYWHLDVEQRRKIKGKGIYNISMLENKGILRPRTKATGALTVRDAFTKFFSTQYAVAEYVGMAEELRLMNTLLNYGPIMEELENKGYSRVRNNIKQLIEWTQDPKSNFTRTDSLLSKLMHGTFRAVLHYSPEVIASQYMSTGHYAGIVEARYWKLLTVPPAPATVKEMLAHNDVVWMRYHAGGQSAELAEVGQLDSSLRLLSGKHADLNKTGIAAQTTDLLAFSQGWKIAKAMVQDNTNLQLNSPEYYDMVNDVAEYLWDTQPSWDKWNKSINTSQRGIKRLPFLFRSYFEKSLMMLHSAGAEYQASPKTSGDKARLTQVYGAVLGSQIATALMRTFIGWAVWRKRKSVWDYLAAMVSAPLAMVSIVGGYMQRVVGNVIRILAGEKQAFEGDPIATLPGETIEQFLLGVGQLADSTAYYLSDDEEKGEKQMKQAIRNLTVSVGTAKGIPVRQMEKIKDAITKEEGPTKLSRRR